MEGSSLVYKATKRLYERSPWLYRQCYRQLKLHWERENLSLLESLVNSGDRVIDIGANIGFYSHLLAEKVGPQGMVYAFEPDPSKYAYLRQIAAKCPQIYAIQKAIGDKECDASLYRASTQVDIRCYPGQEGQKAERRAFQTTIDNFVKSHPITISLVRIDVAGFAHKVIAGMTNLLGNKNNLKLAIRFWPYAIREVGDDPLELLNQLDSYSPRYLRHSSDYFRYLAERNSPSQRDEIFIRL